MPCNVTTRQIQFAGEKPGLFIDKDDAVLFHSALHAVLSGRKDFVSESTVQALSQMLGATHDDSAREVAVLRAWSDCHVMTTVVDPLMRM